MVLLIRHELKKYHYSKVLPFVEGQTAEYYSETTRKMQKPVGTYDEAGKYTTRRRSVAPTPKEYAIAEVIFDGIDVDKSGTVEYTELAKWLMDSGEKPSSVQGWFTKLDTDSNGMITREEWKSGWAKGVVNLQAISRDGVHPAGDEPTRVVIEEATPVAAPAPALQ